MLNEVKVMICGKEYKLRTSESPNYVYSLARVLEAKIDEIVNAGSGSSPYTASIMVALALLDDTHIGHAIVSHRGRYHLHLYTDRSLCPTLFLLAAAAD